MLKLQRTRFCPNNLYKLRRHFSSMPSNKCPRWPILNLGSLPLFLTYRIVREFLSIYMSGNLLRISRKLTQTYTCRQSQFLKKQQHTKQRLNEINYTPLKGVETNLLLFLFLLASDTLLFQH